MQHALCYMWLYALEQLVSKYSVQQMSPVCCELYAAHDIIYGWLIIQQLCVGIGGALKSRFLQTQTPSSPYRGGAKVSGWTHRLVKFWSSAAGAAGRQDGLCELQSDVNLKLWEV
jgi:hypothetical protein